MQRAFFPRTLLGLFFLAALGCDETTPSRDLNPVFCGDPPDACGDGTRSIDLDADQCADRCEAPSCETFAPVECPNGACPVDLDGDGCARECPPQGAFCGGIAGVACPAGQYCDYPLATQCGAGDQGGTCVPLPEVCTEEHAPVCGCDGKTYGNACGAHRAGVSVLHWGACRAEVCPAIAILCDEGMHAADTDGDGCDDGCVPDGGSCGGNTPPGQQHVCAPYEYCHYERADICGYADASGTCRPRPEVCTQIARPVCGCDGKTYGNECTANSYGVSAYHDGACDVVCPEFFPDCQTGYEPNDSDGDGCVDGCAPID